VLLFLNDVERVLELAELVMDQGVLRKAVIG
jgi:hypothetical protein